MAGSRCDRLKRGRPCRGTSPRHANAERGSSIDAFRPSFLNKCDEAERQYYQRVVGKDLPESVAGKGYARQRAARRWRHRRLALILSPVNKAAALSRLKAHEDELRKMGVVSLSVFGSTARGEAGPSSDVDLAATFDKRARIGLFKYAVIASRLQDMLGVRVDLIGEPARTPAMQNQIDQDRVRVF